MALYDDLNSWLQWGGTELIKASETGTVEYVSLLLDGGVPINTQNKVSAV